MIASFSPVHAAGEQGHLVAFPTPENPMKSTIITAVLACSFGFVSAEAQSAPVREYATSRASALANNVTITVSNFDFSTVDYHWWGNQDIGAGIADLLVDGLLDAGGYRVIERKKLQNMLNEQDLAGSSRADAGASEMAHKAKLLGAKYLLTGSITKFGGEQKSYGAGGLFHALGGVGLKKSKTEVAITARVVDVSTGEVVASVHADGVSTKGGGLAVAAFGSGGGGAAGMSSSNFKESAIGEATERAVSDLIVKLTEKRQQLLNP
jgi:curli biogenesis system outer membrane secretion channel CsgG